MPFVTQKYYNNCGAFCLCYLKWLNAGRRPSDELTKKQEEEDRAQIKDVYMAVQFGDGRPVLPPPHDVPPDYCDPMRMTLLLRLEGTNSLFSIDKKSAMFPVFEAMNTPNAREHAFIKALNDAGGLLLENPPLPGPGKAAIAVYNVLDPNDVLLGQHYILIQNRDGSLYRYNPWDGSEADCKGYTWFTYTMDDGEVYKLAPADAAIVTL